MRKRGGRGLLRRVWRGVLAYPRALGPIWFAALAISVSRFRVEKRRRMKYGVAGFGESRRVGSQQLLVRLSPKLETCEALRRRVREGLGPVVVATTGMLYGQGAGRRCRKVHHGSSVYLSGIGPEGCGTGTRGLTRGGCQGIVEPCLSPLRNKSLTPANVRQGPRIDKCKTAVATISLTSQTVSLH